MEQADASGMAWRPDLASDASQLTVQDLSPHLQQQMGASLGPIHLFLLDRPFADQVIHRGFHEGRRDRLVIPISVALIRDECIAVSKAKNKWVQGFANCSVCLMANLIRSIAMRPWYAISNSIGVGSLIPRNCMASLYVMPCVVFGADLISFPSCPLHPICLEQTLDCRALVVG